MKRVPEVLPRYDYVLRLHNAFAEKPKVESDDETLENVARVVSELGLGGPSDMTVEMLESAADSPAGDGNSIDDEFSHDDSQILHVIAQHVDNTEPLSTLRSLLEKTLGLELSDYTFYMQDVHELDSCKPALRPSSARPLVWWNPALSEQRRGLRRLRERGQATIDPAAKETLRRSLRSRQRDYKAEIMKAKLASWRGYCDRSFRGDSFGLPYKILTARQRSVQALPTIQLQDGTCLVVVEGEGLVQVNVKISTKGGLKKINIVDVLRPAEEMVEIPSLQQDDEQGEQAYPDISKIDIPVGEEQENLTKWVLCNQFRKEQERLKIPFDPKHWSALHVRIWIEWAIKQFSLHGVEVDNWNMTGRHLCELSHPDFLKIVPYDKGDLFWTHLQLLTT